jgi:hypothetical protein
MAVHGGVRGVVETPQGSRVWDSLSCVGLYVTCICFRLMGRAGSRRKGCVSGFFSC